MFSGLGFGFFGSFGAVAYRLCRAADKHDALKVDLWKAAEGCERP